MTRTLPAVGDKVFTPARSGVKGTVVTVDEAERTFTVEYPDLDGVIVANLPMEGWLVTSPEGVRIWSADTETHAREQHEMAFPEEPILLVELADPWWIYIDDQYDTNGSNLIAVGPYATEEVVKSAMNDSGQIQGILEDGGVDCWCVDKMPAEVKAENNYFAGYTLEIIIIDPADPSFFG